MSLTYTWWQDGSFFIGYLNDYPDYMTQGETLDELGANLADIYKDICSGEIPFIRHVAQLEIA